MTLCPRVQFFLVNPIYAGKVPLQRERFHQKGLQSLLCHKVREPRQVLGTSYGLQAMYRNATPLDSR